MLKLSFFIAAISGLAQLSAQISIVSPPPPTGTVNVPYYFQLSSYGQQPFTWALLPGAGSLPPGLTLSTAGYISGIPTSYGTSTFSATVSDATGAKAQKQFSIDITDIEVTTFYLPVSVIQKPYSVQLTAIGGSGGPYQWSYYVGGTRTLRIDYYNAWSPNTDGSFTGTPTMLSEPTFEVVAYDPVTQHQSAPQTLYLIVVLCPGIVSPALIPNAEVGVKYSGTTFSVTPPMAGPELPGCAAGPYTSEGVRTLTNLPPGLSMDAAGNITGIPLFAGSYHTVAVGGASGMDSDSPYPFGAEAEFPISILVLPPPTITNSPNLPAGLVGVPYGPVPLSVTGGSPPYSLSATGLVPGLTMNSAGVISGTPTAAGNDSFTIQLIDSLGGKLSETFQIAVTSAVPQLDVPTTALTFAAALGGDAPPPQAVYITSAEGATLPAPVLITSDGGQPSTPSPSWLSLNPSASTTPTRVTVAVDPSRLVAGKYQARVLAKDSNGIEYPISISFNVSPAAPRLTAGPALLQFQTEANAKGTLVQNVIVRNSGGDGAIAVTASVAGMSHWLSVTPSSSQTMPNTPLLLQVEVNPQGLQAGAYQDFIQIESQAGTVNVAVALFVTGSRPALGLSTTAALFQPAVGGSANPRRIEVMNLGDAGTFVNWTATLTTGSDWLRLDTPSGIAPSALTLSLATGATHLTPGIYYALVKVSASNSQNSTQYITAMLNLAPSSEASAPDLSPGGLFFHGQAGGIAPAAQQVSLAGALGGMLQVSSDSSWLTPSLSPDTLTINANPAGLPVGAYTGNVFVSSGSAVHSVNVTLVVEPAASCTPGKVAITESAVGNDFAAVAGLPVVLNVQLNDDCGNVLTDGSVTASFSNGDPVLQLTGDHLGNYLATWQPTSVNPNMVVTLNATTGTLAAAKALLYGDIRSNATPPPVLAANGAVNNFNPVAGGALSPGTIVQVYGSGLAATAQSTGGAPLPNKFDNTFALIGPERAPLYFISSGQVNLQIPNDAAVPQQTPIVLTVNDAITVPLLLSLLPAAPGVLSAADGPSATAPQNGAHIIAQHASDSSLVSATSQAKPGEFLTIYLVGMGATNPSVVSGAASPSGTLASVTAQPTVTVGGISAMVQFAGLTPGFVGLYQINFQVPTGIAAGAREVNVSQNGVAANPTMLPVGN